jgi:hypothetical protein
LKRNQNIDIHASAAAQTSWAKASAARQLKRDFIAEEKAFCANGSQLRRTA